MKPQRITPQEVKQRMDAGEQFVFVDTRSRQAWDSSNVKLPGAIRVTAHEVEQHLGDIPNLGDIPDVHTTVTYCT